MNVEKLHSIVIAIREDLRRTNTLETLQELLNALQSQISSPSVASYQTEVAEHLKVLIEALQEAPSNQFPPIWNQTLEELGVKDFFGSRLAERIQEIFSRNQITPSVAHDELQKIHERLAAFERAINELISAFSQLNIGAEELSPGEAELGVLIPRDFVDNQLEEFAKELNELDDVFSVFAEVATGSRPGFKIQSISSSDLTVFLGLAPKVAACIAVAIERIVALYKKLLEIRKLVGELREQQVPDKSLKGIEEHANAFMDDGIDKVVESVLADFYKNADGARKNELKIELTYSLRKIANRIDRGFNVEVRVEPMPQSEEDANTPEEARYDELIKSASPTLQFLKREGRPILSLPEHNEKKEDKKK